MSNKELNSSEKLSKQIYKFILPAITAMVVSALYNVVDRIFVGRGVGEEALSGIALTGPLMMIISACALLIATGSSIMVSIKLGEEKNEECEEIIANALIISVIVGFLLLLGLLLFLRPILIFFGGVGVTLDYAEEFMKVITFSVIFQIVGYTLNYCIRAEGNPIMSLLTIIIGSIVNIILNPLFIMGMHLGVKGSALSTLVSQVITAVWTCVYFLNSKSILRIRKKSLKLNIKIIKKIITIGIPSLLLQGLLSITLAVANIVFLKYGGNSGLAIIGVISTIYTMFQMIVGGIAQGIAPIIGYNYGANNIERVKETVKIGMVIGTTICCIGFISVILFSKNIIEIFSEQDLDFINIGNVGLKCVCATLPFLGFEVISGAYYQAIGKHKIAIFINILRQSLIIIPLLLLLPKILGLYGCFIAFPITDIIASTIILILIKSEWKRKKNVSEVETIYKSMN